MFARFKNGLLRLFLKMFFKKKFTNIFLNCLEDSRQLPHHNDGDIATQIYSFLTLLTL